MLNRIETQIWLTRMEIKQTQELRDACWVRRTFHNYPVEMPVVSQAVRRRLYMKHIKARDRLVALEEKYPEYFPCSPVEIRDEFLHVEEDR